MSRVNEALNRAAGGPEAESVTNIAQRRAHPHQDAVAVEEYPSERGAAVLPKVTRERIHSVTPAAAPVVAPRRRARLAAEVEGKVVIDASTCQASVEEYRRLAASLHQLQEQGGLRTLMVSSALPRDGKTLTSINLALTLSESFRRRVLLIDADLRRPSVHQVFDLPNAKGLSEGLRSGASGPLPLIEISPQLTVLLAGAPDPSPMAGLTSDRMKNVIAEASTRFDWVILDTPPIALISDAHLLASLVDGVLLVVGAGSTDYTAVKRAVTEFGRERIVGVVLNRVHEGINKGKYYDNYYHDAGSAEREDS